MRVKSFPVKSVRVGETYDRLTVLEDAGACPRRGRLVIVLCACGISKTVAAQDIAEKGARSCGCLRSETVRERRTTHGKSHTREYKIWASMRERCRSNTHYSGRGITVCPEWSSSFAAFLAHVGEAPSPEHEIDRIDNNRGYEPGNVRWATRQLQANNKTTTVRIKIGETEHPLQVWLALMDISYQSYRYRKKRGLTDIEALTLPKNTRLRSLPELLDMTSVNPPKPFE